MYEWNDEHMLNLTGHRHVRFQEEVCPTTGKHHLQGCVIFNNQRHMGGVKKWLNSKKAHLEPTKGSYQSAFNYCSKPESRFEGGLQHESGTMPDGQGSRNDLKDLIERLKNGTLTLEQLMFDHPDVYCRYRNGLKDIWSKLQGSPRNFKTHVSVYYGESGSGKSLKAFETNGSYVLRCSKTGVWWDGYNNEETVVIDDFYGWIPFNMLLNLLDRYPMKVDIKGGAVEFNSKNLIITSNKSPLEWYPNLSDEHKYALLRRIDNLKYFERNSTAIELNDNMNKVLTMINDETKKERKFDPIRDFGSKVLQKGNTIPFVKHKDPLDPNYSDNDSDFEF